MKEEKMDNLEDLQNEKPQESWSLFDIITNKLGFTQKVYGVHNRSKLEIDIKEVKVIKILALFVFLSFGFNLAESAYNFVQTNIQQISEN